jgi:hypothetical protein
MLTDRDWQHQDILSRDATAERIRASQYQKWQASRRCPYVRLEPAHSLIELRDYRNAISGDCQRMFEGRRVMGENA